MQTIPDRNLRLASAWLGLAVLFELVLLRTGTRTLIHIPGLERFEVSVRVLSEAGRLAYYLATVLVVVTLVVAARLFWKTRSYRGRVVAILIDSFIVIATLGRLDLLGTPALGWLTLAVLVAMATTTWRGIRSIPVGFFVISSVVAGVGVLGQGSGGGLSPAMVDGAVVLAEGLLILSGATSPLLVVGWVSRRALTVGVVAGILVGAVFSIGWSTLSILTIWNLGVPGWFPPIAYGIAVGGIAVTSWMATVRRDVLTAAGVVLLVAGGVGMISTYQAALALTAVVVLAGAGMPRRDPKESDVTPQEAQQDPVLAR